MSTIHIMLDLETMGNTPDAAIVEIGAVSWLEGTDHEQQFQCAISLESAMAAGGKVDASTILWWMQQADEPRLRIAEPRQHEYDIASGLSFFTKWFLERSAGCKDVRVWGNGTTADNVWLRRAYERVHRAPPWDFRSDRCYRTLKSLLPHIKGGPVTAAHTALGDAQWQMTHLRLLLAVLSVPLVPLSNRPEGQ